MQCPIHPDLEARFRCEKYAVMMCERCMKCRSPKTHCKHRQQCMIWELTGGESTADESTDEENEPAENKQDYR